jgi:hypothetical protein
VTRLGKAIPKLLDMIIPFYLGANYNAQDSDDIYALLFMLYILLRIMYGYTKGKLNDSTTAR